MCNIDEIANLFLPFDIVLCDTCCFSQSIPTIFFPLLIFVMSFDMLVVEVHQYTIRKFEPLAVL
jgi:hypothetical protein